MKKTLLIAAALLPLGLAMNAQNPYAYKLSADGITDGHLATGVTELTVHYTLNAPAKAVAVEIFNGDQLVKSVPATELTAGDHTVAVPVADLLTGETYTWKVNVEGEAVETPTPVSKNWNVYSPSGLAVDNNPESPSFGQIYMAESYVTAGSQGNEKYISSPGANNGTGVGIYAFDPQLNPIANAQGTYGFKGGISEAWRPNRFVLTSDGRLLVGNRAAAGNPLYLANANDLNQPFTPVFTGTADATTAKVTNGDVTVCNGPVTAMAATGEGENLRLALLTCPGGNSTTPGNYACDYYDLGNATTWGQAPTGNVKGLTGVYAVNYAALNLAYDNQGGLWFGQYRATPSESQPGIVHVNAQGVEDYKNTTAMVRAGGIGFNADKSIFYAYTDRRKLVAYSVTSDNGQTQLTELYTINTNDFNGCNQFAFDVAGNMYLCDNGSEKFGMYQMPRTSNSVATPARAVYAFSLPAATGVNTVDAAKTVVGVTYYNLAGQQSEKAWNGVNVIVTRYSDGSQSAVKRVVR